MAVVHHGEMLELELPGADVYELLRRHGFLSPDAPPWQAADTETRLRVAQLMAGVLDVVERADNG